MDDVVLPHEALLLEAHARRPLDHARGTELLDEPAHDVGHERRDAERGDLDDEVIADLVGDEPGKAVALGVHDAVRVRHRLQSEDLLAKLDRAIHPREDQLARDGSLEPERHEAHADLALRVVEPLPDGQAALVAELDDVAVADLASDAVDRAGEHPGMSEPERPRAAMLDEHFCGHEGPRVYQRTRARAVC